MELPNLKKKKKTKKEIIIWFKKNYIYLRNLHLVFNNLAFFQIVINHLYVFLLGTGLALVCFASTVIPLQDIWAIFFFFAFKCFFDWCGVYKFNLSGPLI